MSFHTYLEQLRAKPEQARRRIALWSSIGIMAVIFAFWAATFTSNIASPNNSTAIANKINTPGKSLIAGVGGLFGDINLIFKNTSLVG